MTKKVNSDSAFSTHEGGDKFIKDEVKRSRGMQNNIKIVTEINIV